MCGINKPKYLEVSGALKPVISHAYRERPKQGQLSHFKVKSILKANMRLIVKWFLSDLHINISLTVDLAQSSLIALCGGSLLHILCYAALRTSHRKMAETTHPELNWRAQKISFHVLRFPFCNLNPTYCHGNSFLLQVCIWFIGHEDTQASFYRKTTGEIEVSIHWHGPCQHFRSWRSQSLSYRNF